MKKGFTLIEILVVTTIIVLLTAAAIVSYSSFLKQSRDAKRKVDLGQVSAALEMYRSNNDDYPATASIVKGASITDITGNKYLDKVPSDPKDPTYTYYYTATASDYTLGAHLESGSGSCGGSCTVSCNYCVGPYGQIYP